MLYGKETVNLPSRFISEIDPSLIHTNEPVNVFDNNPINTKDMYTDKNSDLKEGDLINHEQYGHGVIVKMSGGLIDVAFKTGVKKMRKDHKRISRL